MTKLQRARRAVLTLGALLTAGAIAASVLPTSTTVADTPTPKVFLPIVPNMSTANDTIFGVEVSGLEYSGNVSLALTNGQTLAPGFARYNHISWATVEATPGSYDWTATDAAMLRLSGIGTNKLVVVSDTPVWARDATHPSANGPIPDQHLQNYKNFWKAVVARYSQAPYNVKYWEVYNEPDNTRETYATGGIANFGDYPAEYAKVLMAAHGAIKSADPTATVVFGSLAHDYFNDTLDSALIKLEPGIFKRDFFPKVLAVLGASAGNSFDAVGFHYYPEYDARWLSKKPEYTPNAMAAKAAVLRDYLRAAGTDKPLFNTEIGDRSQPFKKLPGSEDGQARFLTRLFGRSLAANLRSAVWYRLTDDAQPSTEDSFAHNGLIRSDASRKLSYVAFQTASRMIGEATFVKQLTSADIGNTHVEGYLFKRADQKDLRLMWASGTQSVGIPGASSLTVTKKDGSTSTISGNVITLTDDPVYIVSN